ncbi:membrane protein [Vibrio sp. MACH09]|uniref:DUF882 domain-containing protein n=1 Tax=Vibrio sp. MACH09 TaxID=3025122 RepID=UPI00278EE03D|nr:DUF882 domain-containing protein [Vibrio sp. MACH09]GLO61059.1 membrane protein [Vibrio sp. MACH09]
MPLVSMTRRDVIKTVVAGISLATFYPHSALASSASREQKILMTNVHTGEELVSHYFDGVNFVQSELNKIDHICRDFRQNQVFPIDRRLLVQINAIQSLLQTDAKVHIISGYRSPETNHLLRSKSGSGVAKKSLHMQGKALDFSLEGVKLSEVRKAAMSLKQGGVGYYPKSNFVHIDTGKVRSW